MTERAPRTPPHAPVGGIGTPAPWVLLGVGQAWAWHRARGLVPLLGTALERSTADNWSLAPDGRTLRWRTTTHAHPAPPPVMRHLDIPTGAIETSPAPLGLDEDFSGPGDVLCRAEYTDLVAGVWQHTTYTLRSGGDWSTLPSRSRMASRPMSPGVQFTADGQTIATAVSWGSPPTSAIEITDIHGRRSTQHADVTLLGSGAWDPDGTRLLVEALEPRYRSFEPAILDTGTEHTTRLADIGYASEPRDLTLIGWLDHRRLLGYRMSGRTLMMIALDTTTLRTELITEVRSPVTSRDCNGILMASATAHDDPGALASP